MGLASDRSEWAASSDGRALLLRRGVRLEVFTIGWVVIEASGALVAAGLSGSVALLAFGIDSVIELVAAIAVLRRFQHEQSGRDASSSDRRALRLVGASFIALSVYVLADATITLVSHDHPETSFLGLAVAGCALVVMPLLAIRKRRTGRQLDSRALIADSAETVACAWLSAATLVGVGLNAAFGWWWADPIAALVLTPLILNEAREALEGDDD
jgi:divalent metal cation (Fe/Co/Zn/Cd) transporter